MSRGIVFAVALGGLPASIVERGRPPAIRGKENRPYGEGKRRIRNGLKTAARWGRGGRGKDVRRNQQEKRRSTKENSLLLTSRGRFFARERGKLGWRRAPRKKKSSVGS